MPSRSFCGFVPAAMLPEVRDTAGDFGKIAAGHLGFELPILAVAGDQQAALVGQACFTPGLVKATYGTGGYSINVGPTSLPGGGFATIVTNTTVHFKGDIVRVGLNYQFH